MRTVLALPPHLPRQWSTLLTEMGVRDVLASYVWFSNPVDSAKLSTYVRGIDANLLRAPRTR